MGDVIECYCCFIVDSYLYLVCGGLSLRIQWRSEEGGSAPTKTKSKKCMARKLYTIFNY